MSWPDAVVLMALAFIAWYMRRLKGARVADLKAYADCLVQEKDDLVGRLIKQADTRQLLEEAVAALMVAGPEIHKQDSLGALWAFYDCQFAVLEHLGADGLPRKESEGVERG